MKNSPIIVVTCPRSGSSATMGVLEACGMDLGKPVCESLRENYFIRDQICKKILSANGVDPLGQDMGTFKFFDKYKLPGVAETREQIIKHFDTDKIWGFKIIKGVHIWKFFNEMFPMAIWVIIRRQTNKIVDSCMRTNFMNKYNRRQDWRIYVSWYKNKFAEMKHDLHSDQVMEFLPFKMNWKYLTDRLGLQYNESAIAEWIDESKFH